MANLHPWESAVCNLSVSGEVSPGGFVHFSELQPRYTGRNQPILAVYGDERYAPQRTLMKEEADFKLSHDTGLENVLNIMSKGGFFGGHHRISRYAGRGVTFSWWSPRWDWVDGFNLVTTRFKPSYLLESENASRYGNYRFTFTLSDLLDSYKTICTEMGISQEIEFRKLGTFTFITEVMYAVVVCPKECALFNNEENSPVKINQDEVRCNNGHVFGYCEASERGERTWIYNPSCFASYDKIFARCLAWDHLCFAFYLPEGCRLPIPKLASGCSWPTFSIVDKAKIAVNERYSTYTKHEAQQILEHRLQEIGVDIYGENRTRDDLQIMQTVLK